MPGLPTWYNAHWQALLLWQAFLLVLPFAWALKRRRHGIPGVIACLAGGAIVIDLLSRMIWTIHPLMQLFGIAVLYIILIGAVYICFDISFWSSMFLASSGYITQNIASCIKVLLSFIRPFSSLMGTTHGVLLTDLFIYGGVGLTAFFIFRSYTVKGESEFNNRLKAVFSVIVLFVCAGLIRIDAILGLPEIRSYGVQDRVYQILSSCFILALQYGVLEREDMSRQMDAMRELIHHHRVQFETSKQNAQIINESLHDLKKMLSDFRGHLSEEDINTIQYRIGGIAAVARTGNEILDVLLMEKAVLCTQKEIQITCYACESDLDFLEDIDLYFLMNNLLTNAMEATEKMPAGERFITINISRSGDMALIHMENSCQGPVKMENGLPKSQRDPRYHGFGMKSIARLVDKYDGALAVKDMGNVFCVDITLFENAQKAS